jgi:hypothetical protein
MKDNTTRFVMITGIVCFLAGGVMGYGIHSRAKLTPKEFEHRLSRLNGRETVELVKVLDRVLSEPREKNK